MHPVGLDTKARNTPKVLVANNLITRFGVQKLSVDVLGKAAESILPPPSKQIKNKEWSQGYVCVHNYVSFSIFISSTQCKIFTLPLLQHCIFLFYLVLRQRSTSMQYNWNEIQLKLISVLCHHHVQFYTIANRFYQSMQLFEYATIFF